MKYEIRALGITGVLDQAIKLLQDHFRLFGTIVLVSYLPIVIAANLLVVWADRAREEAGADGAGTWLMIAFGLVGLANGLVVYPLCNAAIIYAVSNCYLDKPISVGAAYGRAARVYLPVLGTMMLLGLVVMLGMIACVIPGILFMLWFFLSVQITVLEGLTGTAALGRSRQLMRPNLGTALLLFILVFMIGALIGSMAGLIPQLELRVIVQAVLQAALFVFGAAVWVVFYFSCRARAEHFDLTMLADAVAADEDQSDTGLSSGPAT